MYSNKNYENKNNITNDFNTLNEAQNDYYNTGITLIV